MSTSGLVDIIVIHDTDSENEALTLDSDSGMDSESLQDTEEEEDEDEEEEEEELHGDSDITDFDSEDDAGECQCFMAALDGSVVTADDIPRFDPDMSCSDVLDALIGDHMYLSRLWTDGRTYKAVLMSSALEARREALQLFNKDNDDDDSDADADADVDVDYDSDAEEDLREAKDLIRVLRIHGTSEGLKQCGFCAANDRQRFHGHRTIQGVINNPPPLRRVFHS